MNRNTYHKLSILDGLELLDARQHRSSFPFHIHDTFNITLVLEQPFHTRLTDRRLSAPRGTIFITNPNEVHATICDQKGGNSFFTFYIPPPVFIAANQGKEVFFEDKVIYDDILFHELLLISQAFDTVHAEKKLLAVVQQLVKRYATPDHFSTGTTSLFRRFMEEDVSGKFSLEQTAAKFGLDKYKFLRLFKQQTGLTPNNFLILKRIEKSKELLQSHDNLLDIALESGFYDATHFGKHFKKITGITPLAYRNA